MFDQFCKDNHIGPVTAADFKWWIDKNRYGFDDVGDLEIAWSEYLEEEQDNIVQKLADLIKKGAK